MHQLIEEVKWVKGRNGNTRPATRQVSHNHAAPIVAPVKNHNDGLTLRQRAVSAAREQIHNGVYF